MGDQDDAVAVAHRGRSGTGMGDVMQRPSSRGSGGVGQQPSRANRAAALSSERVQAGLQAPWDTPKKGLDAASVNSGSTGVSTGVRVAAPPGGKSSIQLF